MDQHLPFDPITSDLVDDDDYDDSSDEEYNQRHFGIYQALPVDGEPDWSLSEPDTAEEYLRRVRYEAERCPKVVRVEPSPAVSGGAGSSGGRCVLLPEPEAIPDAPDWAKPNRSWVQQFVSDFQQLRQQVQQAYEQQVYPTDNVPHLNDVEAWDRICFGRATDSDLQLPALPIDDSAEMTQLSHNICSKIMALEQPDVISLFLRHTHQLEELCPSSLPLRRAQWLFALAARLEKPCHSEVAAGFRAVLRHCCKLRSMVDAASDPLLPKLNVLIVMAGAYFAQDEQLCCIVDSSELL